jgi:hypothetical protein
LPVESRVRVVAIAAAGIGKQFGKAISAFLFNLAVAVSSLFRLRSLTCKSEAAQFEPFCAVARSVSVNTMYLR